MFHHAFEAGEPTTSDLRVQIFRQCPAIRIAATAPQDLASS